MSGVKDAAPLTLVLENKLLAILRDHNVNSIFPSHLVHALKLSQASTQ